MAEKISPPSRRPRFSGESVAAIVCGVFAVATSVFALAAPAFDFALPTHLPWVVVAFTASAFALREMAMRRQIAIEAGRHRNALEALTKKNRWLNLTEATAQVGHWRLDLKTHEIVWSDTVFAIHGLPPGSPPELGDALSYFHSDDRDRVADNIEQARETGKPYSFRARIIGGDGEMRHVAASARVEFNEHREPIALFGVLHDRSAEEEMQAELRDARDQANAMAEAKGTFLARMSHEIRTPMNGVLGFAELLGRSDLDAEQRRHTDLIIESGKTLQTLLNDILDLTKIEAGRIEFNPGTVDILHLIYRVTQLLEPAAKEKNIRLVLETAPDLPRHVVLDALRLRQILTNLIANAVRFTDEGGVSLIVKCVDGQLSFAVCDTGTGISPAMQQAIFDPFTQDVRSADKQRGGTGLGLAISRQLAELMNGTLTVRSEPNEGSVFTLKLPLVGADAPQHIANRDGRKLTAAGVTKTATAGHGPDARILLAEDYDINRELMTDMAQRLGMEIDCAEDGVEALAMVNHARNCNEPYALVLMDLQMPRMDGLEATRQIRAAGIDANELPIIALTANAFSDDVERCLDAGMQEHLAKPLSMDILGDALRRWMPASSAAQSSITRRDAGLRPTVPA